MDGDWKSKDDVTLIDEAQRGLAGQGAVTEMTRRLRVSTTRLALVNLALTTVLVVVAVIEVVRLTR